MNETNGRPPQPQRVLIRNAVKCYALEKECQGAARALFFAKSLPGKRTVSGITVDADGKASAMPDTTK
jgi:hypothetical protein